MIHFRKLTIEDIPLMHAWFNTPHVQNFYSLRSWTKQEVLDKLLPIINQEKPLFGFIVLLDSSPIGYLQYCSIKDFPWIDQDFQPNIVENGVGLDIFIGDPSRIGKGLGSKIIEDFLDTVLWPHFEFCIVDPDERNLASIRMFEKSGFKKHKTVSSKDAIGKPVKLVLMIKSNNQ